MPKGAKFIFPRKVHVIIGPPILPPPRPSPDGHAARCQADAAELHASCSNCSTTAQHAPRDDPRQGRAGGARQLEPREVGPSAAAASQGGSSAPHSSRAECIESWGTPTSTVAMPSRVAVIGPIVIRTACCCARRTPATARRPSAHACGTAPPCRRRGVALVAVDLDRRPAVDQRRVIGLVALGVVRVHGVGVVGRHAHDAASSAEEVLARPPPRRQQPLEHVLEQRPGGAGGRWPSRPPRGRTGRSPRRGRRARRRPAPSSPPSTTPGCRAGRWRAASGRRRARRPADVVQARGPRTPASPIRPRSASQAVERRCRRSVPTPGAGAAGGRAPGRVVDVAVEVDGQLRDAGDRLVRRRPASVAPSASDQPAGDAEVAVEPGVEEHAAVDLDGELPPAGRGRCRGAA